MSSFAAPAAEPELMTVALSIERAGGSPIGVQLKTKAQTRTGEVLDALAVHVGLRGTDGAVLAQSLICGHWIRRDTALAHSGLLRGERLRLSVGLSSPTAEQSLRRWSTGIRSANAAGCVQVHRPPRVVADESVMTLRLPNPIAPVTARRFPVGAILIPLVLGLVLVAVVRRPEILLFSLASPIMLGWNAIEDRRTRKSEFAQRSVDYATDLAAAIERARTRSGQWADWLRHTHPTSQQTWQLVDQLSDRLWERRPGDVDFLRLRVGLAHRRAPVQVNDDAGRDSDPEARRDVEQVLQLAAPATVHLIGDGTTAVVGPAEQVAGTARWLICQLCTMHSPRDVSVAFILDRGPAWAWCRWLPHLAESWFEADALARGSAAANLLLAEVVKLIDQRTESAVNRSETRQSAALCLLVDMQARPDPALLATVLERGAKVSVHVIWIGSDRGQVPGQAALLLELDTGRTASLLDHRSGARLAVTPEALDVAQATSIADALSPLVDAAMQDRVQSLADSVLLEELQPELGSPSARRRSWESAPSAQLWAQIGRSVDGPVSLDLGPSGSHVLIGGTTGSGKSELLQAMVTSLAASYPPSRVAFLLIDYKGGAAFKDAVQFPHTVGLVTDLDRHLTRRMLLALEAEIRRRERLLSASGARDLLELRRLEESRAPADLLIVVDEFAALAKEIPEFVEGIVDIAARGRSLGLRLVLATQRPAGVISDRIRANVGVRIALRVNDEADSQDILDMPTAAHISRSKPGRAFLRTHQEVLEFQAAYVGSAATIGEAASITIRELDPQGAVGAPPSTDHGQPVTVLESVVDATNKVMKVGRWPKAHVPWLPPLPPVLSLAELGDPARPGLATGSVILGQADQPERQQQPVVALDFDRHQNVLIYGTSRSGKTTALRTIAAGLISSTDGKQLHLYALDFAGQGLYALAQAPQCGAVITGDDPGRIARLIRRLRRTIDERKRLLADCKVTDFAALLASHQPAPPARVVVLLDSYAGAVAVVERFDGGRLLEQFHRLVSEGPGLGVHFVITADRRAAVPGVLSSVITTRLVLRMAERDDYALLGVDGPSAGDVALSPGRGVIGGGIEIQVAVLSQDPSGQAQLAELAVICADARHRSPACFAPPLQAMPERLTRADLPAASAALDVALGIGEDELKPWWADLSEGHFLICGPLRSGKTTALATLACGLDAAADRPCLILVAPRRSRLKELGIWDEVADDAMDLKAVEVAMAGVAGSLANGRAVVLICDDADQLPDPVSQLLESHARSGRDQLLRVVAATDNRAGLRSYSGLVPELRKSKSGLLLAPDIDIDGDLLGVRLRASVETMGVPGRGYAVSNGLPEVVQVAR